MGKHRTSVRRVIRAIPRLGVDLLQLSIIPALEPNLLTSQSMASKIRVLVVDDHPFTREGLRFILENSGLFNVVGEASDGQEGVAQAIALQPDVVVMDFRMPRLDGLQATQRLHASMPGMRVLILTAEATGDFRDRVLKAGALGWLPKNASPEELVATLENVSGEG